MNKLDFAIITPSYAPDFERCRLLSWSVEKFISPSVTHYIIVPESDLPLFRQLQKPNTEIITVESVLPWWIQRLPLVKNGWLSLKTVFIRGWILQQIVKLGVAQYIDKDAFVFADSDVTFIRPLNVESFVREDQVRLFRVADQCTTQFIAENPIYGKCLQTASSLLGLPPVILPAPGYIGQVITWKRDNLFKLYQHIESISGKDWIETVCNSWYLSEYILYGVFVDQILKERSGHFYDSERICHEYWSTQTMSDDQLKNFFTELLPNDKAVMISAKAGISPQQYQNLVNLHSIRLSSKNESEVGPCKN
jgi:hypothetical protein